MFTTTSSDHPSQKSLQIKEDDKFFCRLLSKETSMANPSFRVYSGGVTVAVPFTWESQPGTPKYSLCESTLLPPLTPPPSFYSNSNAKPIKKHSRSNLLHFLLSRINPKKTSSTADSTFSPSLSSSSPCSSSAGLSPTSSSASSWSSWNSTATPGRKCHERSRFSSFDSRVLFYDDQEIGSPTSTLCFGGSRWR